MNIDTFWEIMVGDEFEIAIDRTVNHMEDTSGVLGEGWVVGDHNNSITGLMNAMKFLHNSFGTLGIEAAGRLVGKNDFRISDQGASNGDALLLTTGELVRVIIFFSLEIEIFQSFGSLNDGFGMTDAGVNKRKSDILKNGESRDEVIFLENNANFLGTKFGETTTTKMRSRSLI